jgi:hypothetical protein
MDTSRDGRGWSIGENEYRTILEIEQDLRFDCLRNGIRLRFLALAPSVLAVSASSWGSAWTPMPIRGFMRTYST